MRFNPYLRDYFLLAGKVPPQGVAPWSWAPPRGGYALHRRLVARYGRAINQSYMHPQSFMLCIEDQPQRGWSRGVFMGKAHKYPLRLGGLIAYGSAIKQSSMQSIEDC
jgi:hypothetical protein